MAKLQKISVMSLAKMFCVLNAVVGFILGLIVAVGSLDGQQGDGFWSLGMWAIPVFPIVNAGLGFMTGTFIALGYNLLSQWFGGIEFEIEKNEHLTLANTSV